VANRGAKRTIGHDVTLFLFKSHLPGLGPGVK